MIRRFLSKMMIPLAFLAGLSLLLYPSVSNWWNSLHTSRSVASYMEAVENMDEEVHERMWLQADAYNQKLSQQATRLTLTEAEMEEYQSILDISGSGIMGYIDIPRIKVTLPIYHGTSEEVLQVAVGHLEGTSLPVGGPTTHCVLSGHRGLPSARLFTDVNLLTLGDTFTLSILGQTLTYEVDQIRTVLPHELQDLQRVPGADFCTLVTCTPYGVNSHRLLVRGHRVENVEEAQAIRVVSDGYQIDPLLVAPIAALPLVVVFGIVVSMDDRMQRRMSLEKYRYTALQHEINRAKKRKEEGESGGEEPRED